MRGRHLRLLSRNERYETIETDKVEALVVGVVVGRMGNLELTRRVSLTLAERERA